MSLVSVIIPVYNSEMFLEDCLISVLDQTYSDLEVIVINDGSTDSSARVCDAMAESDPRINVIHTQNQGVSQARNTGIDLSNGEYIVFVDSDDKMDQDGIEVMVNALVENDADLVVTGFVEHNIETGISEVQSSRYAGLYDAELIRNNILNDSFFGKNKNNLETSCWAKLFKREIIERHKIKFDPLLNYGEDTLFVFEYMLVAKSSYFLNNFHPYIFFIHQRSASLQFEQNRYQRRKYMISKYHEILGREYKRNYNRIYFLMMLEAYYPLSKISYSENKVLVKYELKNMLSDNKLNESIKYVKKRTLTLREIVLLFLIKGNFIRLLLLFIKSKNLIYNLRK